MRLQKFLANAGVASRRHSEEIIRNGDVKINGDIIKDPATDVTDSDVVEVFGKIIEINERYKYFILNKPVGYISAAFDSRGGKCVTELIRTKDRIYPVGRLDINTEGLLLITNDGEFTNLLLHPRYEVKKTYVAMIKGHLDKDKLYRLENGIVIDNRKTNKAKVKIIKNLKSNTKLEITISEGRNRQIRKMFQAVENPVIKLKRIKMWKFTLGNLLPGEYRKFNTEEMKFVEELKNGKKYK